MSFKLKQVNKGSTPTLLVAEKANEVINAINSLSDIRIHGGTEERVEVGHYGVDIYYKTTEAESSLNGSALLVAGIDDAYRLTFRNGIVTSIMREDSPFMQYPDGVFESIADGLGEIIRIDIRNGVIQPQADGSLFETRPSKMAEYEQGKKVFLDAVDITKHHVIDYENGLAKTDEVQNSLFENLPSGTYTFMLSSLQGLRMVVSHGVIRSMTLTSGGVAVETHNVCEDGENKEVNFVVV